MRQFSESAWQCADPGMQFDTTINTWHTSPNSGRINGSNLCSEYMHIDNSACNLASINLPGTSSRTASSMCLRSSTPSVFTAQEIWSATRITRRPIAENSRKFRQLGPATPTSGAAYATGSAYDSTAGVWAAATPVDDRTRMPPAHAPRVA
jgi:ribonucleoside-diphosphate reductase alpha chain